MSLKSFPTYNDPNYIVRDSYDSGLLSGATQVAKYVAHANLYLYGLSTYLDTIGTSTYSSTTSAQTVSVYVVSNTSTTTTVALTTATYGPYVAGGQGAVAQAGGGNIFSLNTNTGAAGVGGVYVPALSEIYFQSGTDATAKVTARLDYQIAPLAAFTA
jgi:hypothetical protein